MGKKRRGNGQGTLFKRQSKGPWIASWYDHTGKRRWRSTRTTDRRAAQRILDKYVADTALRREGVVDPRLDAICEQSKRSVEAHLADYEAMLKAGGRSEKHIATTTNYVRAFAKDATWATVADINADAVNRFAAKLKSQGRSARTTQAHLTAIKGFTKWLAMHHKLPRDPLVSVKKPNPQADRKRERRMLLREEWDWLRPITQQAPERYGMTGEARALLYAVAIQTGLRSSELRSLTQGHLFLDGDKPYIVCKAKQTKNSKNACQYIQPDLARDLRQHVGRKLLGASVFHMPDAPDVADMLREDLADTRAAWLKAAENDPEEH